ncbi:MAG TPA: hypothetical protein VEM96_18970 [Pyrinomonadaceae bacterium]|nr:hypothetical protein [Pyrinomonadaceae bacterium]
MEEIDILLKEYKEAGTLCRNAEQLTRTSLSIFVPTATILVAVVAAPGVAHSVKLALSVAGIVYAVLLGNTVRRQSLYYISYMQRAKDIESLINCKDKPVMKLYTNGATATDGSRTFSNERAIVGVFSLAALYFAGAAIWHVLRICGVF